MTAIAKREDAQVVEQDNAVLSMIERAARDPQVDIEKMRQLLQMRADEEARAVKREFNEALALVQAETMPVAADASNPQTHSKYASYYALDKALRPIYTKHGFALTFDTEPTATPEMLRVVCYLSRGGHTQRYQIDMPADGKGAKGGDVMTKTHATGSGITYGQRYLLKLIFNIAVGGDDDGNRATAIERLTQEQADALHDLLESTGAPKAKFLKWAKVEKVEDIAAEFYDSCVDAIKRAATK
jgi:predicted DNA-binding protein